MAMLDAALVKSPGHAELINQKAQMLQTLGKIDEAVALMEGVARTSPQDLLSRYMLLDLYLMKGDDEARRKVITVLQSGTFAHGDVARVLVVHGMQVAARTGRLTEAQLVFDAGAAAAEASGTWHMLAWARAWHMDALQMLAAWDAVKALEPELDRLSAAPEMPEIMSRQIQLSRLRASLRRELNTGDAKAARAILSRMEKLDDSYFYVPRHVLLGIDSAAVLAREGKADEARAALAGATVDVKKEVMAPVINTLAQLSVSRFLRDRAGERTHGTALAGLADMCLALQSDDKLVCRGWIVVGTVAAAEVAHEQGDDVEARRLLTVYDRIWPAIADAPMAVRANALKAALVSTK